MKPIKKYKSIFRLLKSPFKALRGGFSNTNFSTNRIMIIYDTTRQPFAVGDFLVTQIAGLINCHKFKVDLCDFVIVYESKSPDMSDSVFSEVVDRSNILLIITSLMSILNLNQVTGSVFVFNSKSQAERYIYNNITSYKNIFPGFIDFTLGTYLNHLIFNDLIYSFYVEKNFLPKLVPNKSLQNWVNHFMSEHIGHSFPVTVNIRNNPNWGIERNSKIAEWKKFFEYCIDKFPVKFIVICVKSEIPDELKILPNVIFAKDYQTELDQELTLIANSKFHMGANSGPAAMAYFGSNPYFIFGLNLIGNKYSDFLFSSLVQEIAKKKFKFIFSGLGQSFTSEPETFDLLCQSFLDMFNMIKDSDKVSYVKNDPLKRNRQDLWIR